VIVGLPRFFIDSRLLVKFEDGSQIELGNDVASRKTILEVTGGSLEARFL
jgi:hypothetical protein